MSIMLETSMLQIAIFGTGGTYQRCKELFSAMKIICFLDNEERKWGTVLDGIKILSPKDGVQRYFHYIYIASLHYMEIRIQLRTLGVPQDKIRDIHDLALALDFPRKTFLPSCTSNNSIKKKALLITHELSLTGAPIMMLYAAKALKKEGMDVCIVSPLDGNLRDIYIQNGFTVIIDEAIPFTKLDYLRQINIFDFIVVNTLALYYLFASCTRNNAIVWWIHEGETAYKMLPSLPYINYGKCKILACSNRAKEAFLKRCPQWPVAIQLNGLADIYQSHSTQRKEKKIFALVGTVEPRKGQDIFIAAIKLLPTIVQQNSEFWIVGNDMAEYAKDYVQHVKRCAEMHENIIFFHELSRDKMKKLYHKIDILVCPSKEESFSLASAEAMSCCKPCIVTNQAGISDYICNEENGLICQADDVQDLADKMAYCYYHPENVAVMGREARKLYENHFSLEAFEKGFISNIVSVMNEG